MPDTFDLLRERSQGMRVRRYPMEWSSIDVEMVGEPHQTARSLGDARVDNSLFRNLTGGEPTCFQVEPGEHTVTVHLSRWFRLSEVSTAARNFLSRSRSSPERQVKLVCGLRPGAKEEWRMIRIARVRPIFVFQAGWQSSRAVSGLAA